MNQFVIDMPKESVSKLWFTSDSHYFHKNITYGETSWPLKEGTRMFETRKEMSEAIVDGINNYVNEDDILIHLGDWSFGGIQNIWNFRKQLNVKTIHLVLGNHDNHIKCNKVLYNCYFDETKAIIQENITDNIVYSQDLFTSVNNFMEIMIDNKLIHLCHYPLESWPKNSYHLHGHTHGTLNYKKNRLDVGIDNAFKIYGIYKPFSYSEIVELINN